MWNLVQVNTQVYHPVKGIGKIVFIEHSSEICLVEYVLHGDMDHQYFFHEMCKEKIKVLIQVDCNSL